jgi:DNA replication protein DnaC
MYGPPGNGKTISIEAIMKDALDKGYSPLYVKSFKSNPPTPRIYVSSDH